MRTEDDGKRRKMAINVNVRPGEGCGRIQSAKTGGTNDRTEQAADAQDASLLFSCRKDCAGTRREEHDEKTETGGA